MTAKVILIVTHAATSGQKYIFENRATCIIGRNQDCHLVLPKENRTSSRYHCLLDINPPQIRLRDFGSLNGTYINEKKLVDSETYSSEIKSDYLQYDLQHGDRVQIGNTLFRVFIESESTPNQVLSFLNTDISSKPNLLGMIKTLVGKKNRLDKDLKNIGVYKILKLLGKGMLGEVYLAQHSYTHKNVALKVMLPRILLDTDTLGVFINEIENHQILEHPHILNLEDFGYIDNLLFFAMEYCEKGNIDDLMQQYSGKLPIDLALKIILQVLDALIYSHNINISIYNLKTSNNWEKSNGLVHRNLKPTNILLTHDGDQLTAKISEYGLYKVFDLMGFGGLTLTKTPMVTPGFTPRQQIINFRNITPDLDIWSVAACLYYMLTGCFPRNFNHDPWLDVLQNKTVLIRERNADIPKKLAAVIDLALLEKPQIYFQSALEFKDALLGCGF